jgi:hypothetical protein
MKDPTINALARANAARIYEANWAARDRGLLSIWTVYDHPKDCPDGFIARRFEAGGGNPDAVATADVVTGDLASIRESMVLCGLCRMSRAPSDNPKIVETLL